MPSLSICLFNKHPPITPFQFFIDAFAYYIPILFLNTCNSIVYYPSLFQEWLLSLSDFSSDYHATMQPLLVHIFIITEISV